jgi:hypothetical protein
VRLRSEMPERINYLSMDLPRAFNVVGLILLVCVGVPNLFSATLEKKTNPRKRVVLNNATIVVDSDEASYVKYGVKDLSSYIAEITGRAPIITSSLKSAANATPVIVIGEKMAVRADPELTSTMNRLGHEGFIIRSSEQSGRSIVVAAGTRSHGTNFAIATLMQLIRSEGKSAYLDGPINQETKPSFEVRGIHLNGWPVNYPYAFRTWKEDDWKRFVDIAWIQRANVVFIWPFMDIIPVPVSKEDESYLREVARIIDYAQKQRGMEVWIMQSANRIGVSDCGTSDPRNRAYWVMGRCQKDMDPSDPEQFAKIVKSFEALYSTVRNPDAFCLIDNDPGGWPNSPLSEQVKIFREARSLLDRLSIKGQDTKLIDWMWLGWGYPNSPIDNPRKREEFFERTIRSFKTDLPAPWELLAGNDSSLRASQEEATLARTTYIPYGAIEEEPSFPSTNVGMEPVRKALELAAQYQSLKGVIGNNEMMLLQFPRTFYFLKSAWNKEYETHNDMSVYQDVANQLYPENAALIAQTIEALTEQEPRKIAPTLARLQKVVNKGEEGRPGALGRYLFPDSSSVARILLRQIEIQMARESFIQGLRNKPSAAESERLLGDYLDKLLAWNRDTGWNRMVDIGIWREPIYRSDASFTEAMSELRHVLEPDTSHVSNEAIQRFFDRLAARLTTKYDRDSVMSGCISPMEKAVMSAR